IKSEIDSAEFNYEKISKKGDHHDLAMLYLKMGLKDKAIDELVLAIKENPDNHKARFDLAVIENNTIVH
ncbi:MAG: tetratricopeptide repeat protein, partial [bacterium]|nr:tetratricopeptide repeat protein [bacterium]